MSEQDIRSRYIGPCYSQIDDKGELKIDLSAFLIRLLLFDTYILDSIGLKELRGLISAFGYGGMKEILSSGALRIHLEPFSVGQTGQTGLGFRGKKKDGTAKPLLPLHSYSFGVIKLTDQGQKEDLHKDLHRIHEIDGLKYKEVKKLKKVIADRLIWLPRESAGAIIQQLLNDIRMKTPNIKRAILSSAKQNGIILEGQKDITFDIEVDSEEDVHVRSNLTRDFGMDDHTAHKVIGRALLAIGGLNQRIETMRAFSAITGFRESELNIFEDKVEFIINKISPEAAEKRVRSILSFPQFPDLEEAIRNKRVDIQTLLKVRDSIECREFRQWLWTSNTFAVDELRERSQSMMSKLSLSMSSRKAKAIRCLSIAGIGLINDPVCQAVSFALSLLETFLLDKLFRSSGTLTFIGRMYPSLFRDT